MPDTHVTKNYFTEGGDELVIGGKLTVLEGAEVEGLSGGGGSYTLPAATADKLGGIKVGSGLTITDGVLSATGITPAEAQADSTASSYTGLKDDFNALLAKLRAAGLLAANAGA
jgi:hypothetical protein